MRHDLFERGKPWHRRTGRSRLLAGGVFGGSMGILAFLISLPFRTLLVSVLWGVGVWLAAGLVFVIMANIDAKRR
jgi:type IV secretory pathway TrbD component